MAFKLAPRTRQFITSIGEIDVAAVIDLGLVTNTDLNSFIQSVGDGNQTIVCVVSGNAQDWQECLVTVDDASPDTLTVNSIIASSIAGVIGTDPITLEGTSKVFGVIPTDFGFLFNQLFGTTPRSIIGFDGANWAGTDILYVRSILAESEDSPTGTSGALDNYIDSQNEETAFPIWALRQYGGTKAAPTAIVNGTVLGAYTFYAWDGVSLGLGPTIQAVATEDWDASSHGSKLLISFNPIGGTTPDFSFSLDDDGLAIGGNLVNTFNHYTIGFSAPQTTAYDASQVIGHHPMTCNGVIPADFGAYGGRTSKAGGTANATGSTVISIDRATAGAPNTFSQIGTVTIGAGGVAATFATVGGTAKTLTAGDIIRAVMPASPDATFAGFYLAIVAQQTP